MKLMTKKLNKNYEESNLAHKNDDAPCDVIIIGGGLSGLTLTCLLAANGIRTKTIDIQNPSTALDDAFDGRTTAISFGSQKVLKAAGLWDKADKHACPIETIQIMDSSRKESLLDFNVNEVEGTAFGWIFENRILRQAMYERIEELGETATLITPAKAIDFEITDDYSAVTLNNGQTHKAALIIGCDGRKSFTRQWMGINTREWSYKQRAIVCSVIHENPHDNIAVEHFRKEGPFAVLPMTDDKDGNHRSSIVWTEHAPFTNSALKFDIDTFNIALTARFPSFYGAVKLTGERFAYPLNLVHAHDYTASRMALVADAAHGIHPIAGQGLNMGLRDVAEIADLIITAHNNAEDIGADTLLDQYQKNRRFDNMAMAGATDSLNRLFSNDYLPIKIARQAGLKAVSRINPVKKFFMNQAMGSAGLLPALIKDQ